MWNAIAEQISQTIQQPFKIQQKRFLRGGCINIDFI